MIIHVLSSVILTGILIGSIAINGRTIHPEERRSYVKFMESHFHKMISSGTDVYGPVATPMWMSVLDTRTGRLPDKPHTPKRVYRLIGAPQGTTLYWDQPLVVAAYELSKLTGDPQYEKSADLYIKAFLDRCVDESGMFLWGNHQYYNAVEDKIIRFHGGYHELRPITPAWELFWQNDRDKCSKYIRTMAHRHVYDIQTGGFNRHDDGKRGHAFIESGGILVESLTWLYAKTGERDLLTNALNIARYSHSHRGKSTGLVKNEPDFGRWDSKVSTTEVGVWAQSLLRASEYSSKNEFTEMARSAVSAYLKYGFDSETQQYFGQIAIQNGKPVTPEKDGYWPGTYSNLWETRQWPTHDYPMAVAEACITLYAQTKDKLFREGIYRWAKMISDNLPNEDRNAYAEHYGRCIHFLTRAGMALDDTNLTKQAHALANKAIEALYEDGMFQGFPGTHLYESVDGVGYLFLALIYLETGKEPDLRGFGF